MLNGKTLWREIKQKDFFFYLFFWIFVYEPQSAVCTKAQQLLVPWLTPDRNLCAFASCGFHTVMHCRFLLDHLIFFFNEEFSLSFRRDDSIENFLAFWWYNWYTPHRKQHLHFCSSVVLKFKNASGMLGLKQFLIQEIWSEAPEFAVLRNSTVMQMLLVAQGEGWGRCTLWKPLM